jgi:hypothetical protein
MDNILWLKKLHDPDPAIIGSGSGAFGLPAPEKHPGNGKTEAAKRCHTCAVLTARIYTE